MIHCGFLVVVCVLTFYWVGGNTQAGQCSASEVSTHSESCCWVTFCSSPGRVSLEDLTCTGELNSYWIQHSGLLGYLGSWHSCGYHLTWTSRTNNVAHLLCAVFQSTSGVGISLWKCTTSQLWAFQVYNNKNGTKCVLDHYKIMSLFQVYTQLNYNIEVSLPI